MALVKWEPFEGLTSLRRGIDRLFEDFFQETPWRAGATEPAVDVAETDEAIIVKAQVPGVKKDQLQVQVTENAITLKGEVKEEEEKKEKQYYHRELRYGAFQRTIPLPMGVKTEQAKAQLKEGVLQVTIPKSEEAKTKTKAIPIEG